MSRLTFAEAARRDLEEAVAFVAQDSPAAAGRMVGRIEAVAAMLLAFPRAGAALARARRVVSVGGTPFRLVDRETRDGITILRVWHGAHGWPPARYSSSPRSRWCPRPPHGRSPPRRATR